MFSIGDFSKITGLTVKSLRFYHEQGLLEPSAIDDQSGYRYYDRSKIDRARVISYLRTLDFSLSEIASILKADGDDNRLLERAGNNLQRQPPQLPDRNSDVPGRPPVRPD